MTKGSRGNTFVVENGTSWEGVDPSRSVSASCGGSGSSTEASSGTIGVIYGSQSRYLNGQRCQVDSVQAQRVHLSHTSLYFVSLDTLY